MTLYRQSVRGFSAVELKQWSGAERFEDSDTLVRIEQYGERSVTHPVLQVRGYCDYMLDFTAVLATTPSTLAGVAYLHNATDNGVSDLFRIPGDRLGSVFTGQRRSEFRGFLRSRFAEGQSGASYADALFFSRIAPSKQLLAVAKRHQGRQLSGRSTDPQCVQGATHAWHARCGDPLGRPADE